LTTATQSKDEMMAERAAAAKKLTAATARKVTKILGEQTVDRSTRTRHVLKAKAEAFDQIANVLAGKDA
jgi:hypothetical protein